MSNDKLTPYVAAASIAGLVAYFVGTPFHRNKLDTLFQQTYNPTTYNVEWVKIVKQYVKEKSWIRKKAVHLVRRRIYLPWPCTMEKSR